MNRFNSLKNVQQFNVQISKTNKKVKEKKHSVYNFMKN